MRGADGWKLLQNVGVRLETAPRTLIFRQEREAIVDDVSSQTAAVGVHGALRRIETQDVRKRTLPVDRGNRFLSRVVARVAHQMHELIEPSSAVVDWLARVVVLFGVIRVVEAADAGVAGTVNVKPLTVAPHTASPPDVNLGLGTQLG